jgi:plastocyanin
VGGDPAALRAGLQLYGSMCLTCHGAPGTRPAEFATGLHPPAPDLSSAPVQSSFSDGMLYEAIARGIGSTGMPALGKLHPPGDIWKVVAFVRHLPALTEDERHELARLGPGEPHVEGGGPPGEAPSQGGPGATASTGRGGVDEHLHQVSISKFQFVPPTVKAHLGDTVEWKNEDFTLHTANADDRSFDTGDIQPNEAKRIVVRKQGQFTYTCKYHPAMKGTLIVE